MKKIILFGLFAFAVATAVWFFQNSRAATETPDYQLVRQSGDLEIRDYPDLKIVSAAMEGEGMNGSFGNLFRYISGENAKEEKIAMTTPVLIDRSTQAGSMSFIVPKEIAARGAPEPKDEKVKLSQKDSARFAALRFQGTGKPEEEKAAIEKLRSLLATEKITPIGTPIVAYYDPPWTPAPLRRNEVMLQIAKTQ
jgi:DNA gyrase inhibitor GyrI